MGRLSLAVRQRIVDWLLRDVHVRSLLSGERSLVHTDKINATSTAAATALGDLACNVVSGRWSQFRSGASRDLLDTLDSQGGAVLLWGNSSVASTTTTRYLNPGFSDTGLAPTSAVQWRTPRAGTAKNLRIRHNTTAGNGNAIVYTVRKNNVATALTVSLASTSSDGSDLVNTVSFATGDLIDIEITKAAGVGASPDDVVAVAEFT